MAFPDLENGENPSAPRSSAQILNESEYRHKLLAGKRISAGPYFLLIKGRGVPFQYVALMKGGQKIIKTALHHATLVLVT